MDGGKYFWPGSLHLGPTILHFDDTTMQVGHLPPSITVGGGRTPLTLFSIVPLSLVLVLIPLLFHYSPPPPVRDKKN